MSNSRFNAAFGDMKVLTANKKTEKFSVPVIQITTSKNTMRLYEKATELLGIAKGDVATIVSFGEIIGIHKGYEGSKGFKCGSVTKASGIGQILSGADGYAWQQLGGVKGESKDLRICSTPFYSEKINKGQTPIYFVVAFDDYEESMEEEIANMQPTPLTLDETSTEEVLEEVIEDDYSEYVPE